MKIIRIFNVFTTIIIGILLISNQLGSCQSNEPVQVNWDNPPYTITIRTGSTITFTVNTNTGDHIVFARSTPPGVVSFISPLLNANRFKPSYSYTFVNHGDYILMDMFTNREMRLTVDNNFNTTTTTTSTNPNLPPSSTTSKDTSSVLETSGITTTTSTDKDTISTSTYTKDNGIPQQSNSHIITYSINLIIALSFIVILNNI